MIWQKVAIGVDIPIKNKLVSGRFLIIKTIGILIAIPPIRPCTIEKKVFPIPLKYPIKQNMKAVKKCVDCVGFQV